MTIYQITMPILNRDALHWSMEFGDIHPQDRAIRTYIDAGSFPEEELIQVLVRAVRPGDYVIDCGACTGFFSLLMGALGASVLAIEPGANNLPSLYRNVELNQFPIDIRPVALGNKTEIRDFLLMDDGGVNSFTQPADRWPGEAVRVDVRRLPDLIGERSPKLIKMDIEGAEFEALESFVKSYQFCPYIIVEYNLEALDRAGVAGDQLRRLMQARGYELFVLFSDGMLPMMVPRNTEIKCHRQNTNVLFSTPDAVGRLWGQAAI